MRLAFITIAALGLLFFWISPAHAEPTRGEVLAAACAQCHGTEGRAVSSWPSIAGKSMYNTLLERKYRSPEGIMDMQARGYTNEQLHLIAEFYASQRRGGD